MSGVPYFEAVRGPDRKYHWAKCPACGEVVLNADGGGPGRHWLVARHPAPVPTCEGSVGTAGSTPRA